jgi:methyltransferase (TIGR00027 family)
VCRTLWFANDALASKEAGYGGRVDVVFIIGQPDCQSGDVTMAFKSTTRHLPRGVRMPLALIRCTLSEALISAHSFRGRPIVLANPTVIPEVGVARLRYPVRKGWPCPTPQVAPAHHHSNGPGLCADSEREIVGWTMTRRENLMPGKNVVAPDSTAVRTALWRALHLEVDSPPPVFEDRVGLMLADPEDDWRDRPDMSPFTRPFRASILARARFVEELVTEQVAHGVGQYVILGAGLDTFAQRRADLAGRLRVFEIDQPGAQEWKRQRLAALGFDVPSFLRLVPVNFEAGGGWGEQLVVAGFESVRAAVVASTGVSMYLTRDAITATLRQVAVLAPGSTLVMSFMLPIEQLDPEVRPGVERAAEGARASGTPFISFFTPVEMLALAHEAGFKEVRHVSAAMLVQRYFADRTDGLRPPNNSEELLVATT